MCCSPTGQHRGGGPGSSSQHPTKPATSTAGTRKSSTIGTNGLCPMAESSGRRESSTWRPSELRIRAAAPAPSWTRSEDESGQPSGSLDGGTGTSGSKHAPKPPPNPSYERTMSTIGFPLTIAQARLHHSSTSNTVTWAPMTRALGAEIMSWSRHSGPSWASHIAAKDGETWSTLDLAGSANGQNRLRSSRGCITAVSFGGVSVSRVAFGRAWREHACKSAGQSALCLRQAVAVVLASTLWAGLIKTMQGGLPPSGGCLGWESR